MSCLLACDEDIYFLFYKKKGGESARNVKKLDPIVYQVLLEIIWIEFVDHLSFCLYCF